MTHSSIWQAPQFLPTRTASDLWNALLSYRERPLAAQGSNASFRFSVAEAPDAARSALLVKTERGPAFVAVIERFPFEQMFGIDLDLPDLLALPAALRSCIEEGVLSAIWQAAPYAATFGRPHIIASGTIAAVATHTDGWDNLQWLSVTIDGVTRAPVAVLVGFSVATFAPLVSRGILAQSIVSEQLAAAIATDAHYTIGGLSLSYRALSGLAPGDLVVLPHHATDEFQIRADDALFTVRRSSNQFLCVNKELAERYRRSLSASEDMTIMRDDPDGSIDAPASIEELNVVIDFDIGRTAVTLADLASWQPGTTVDIDPPMLNENVNVTVRANGQVIGTGDLVLIDDRVAVRLTRLTFRSETGWKN